MNVNPKLIRQAAGMSLRDMAASLGLSERSGDVTVAQIEARHDWLLSSLAAYIRAAGGTAALIVLVGGDELVFEL